MKFISTWKVKPGKLVEAVDRFLGGPENVPPGVKTVCRWHRIDMQGGVHLLESNDPALIAQYTAQWAELLEVETTVALEDAQAAEAYSKIPGTQAYKKTATG